MAHLQQQRWLCLMRSIFPEYFINSWVLDVGSANINGTNRFLFKDCDYVGTDIMKYKNVDKVIAGKDITGKVETVICTEVLEHDPDWKLTVENLIKVSTRCLIITCASTGRPEHGTTRTTPPGSPFKGIDYYRNITPGDLLDITNGKFKNYIIDCTNNGDLYFIGFKWKAQIDPSRFTFLRLYFYRFFLNRLHDYHQAIKSIGNIIISWNDNHR